MAVLTHRTDGSSLVMGYLFQLQGGGSAAQVVDVGIVGKTDEAILIDDIQGSGDALLSGVFLFQYQFYNRPYRDTKPLLLILVRIQNLRN